MSPTPTERSHTCEPEGRKRVPKACDRCRLKKVKCDGNLPCPRCRMEDAVCHFGARRKSAERPVAPGYLDQLETQQKILIKALKKTWKTYVPKYIRSQMRDDPSIHEIVKRLGALEDASGLHVVSPDFYFNESVDALKPTVKIEPGLSSTERRRMSSHSSNSSCASALRRIDTTHEAGVSNSSSPSQSSASSHSSVDSASSLGKPVQDTNGDTSQPTASSAPTAIRPKMGKPTFCPIPKPYFAPPVKLSRITWDGMELDPSVQDFTESMWTTPNVNWNNLEYGAQAAGSNYGSAFDDLPPMVEDGWGSLIDEPADYVSVLESR